MNSILSVATIGQQVSGVAFPVSGTVELFPSIEYSDDGGATFQAAPGSATAFGSSNIVFSHPGIGVVSGTTVTVKDNFSGAVGVSNPFAVIAVQPPQILPNAPTDTAAGVAFLFTGVLLEFPTAPSLVFSVDGQAPTALTGVNVSGWSESIAIAASGAHTIVVSGAGVSGSVSFSTAAAVVIVPPTTWNGGAKSSTISLSPDGLTATTSTTVAQSVLATTAIPVSGLVAFEVTITEVATDWATGIANGSFNLATHGGLGTDANGIGLYVNSPTQAAYYNAADLNQGSSASVTGEQVSIIVNGEHLWWSDPTMRVTAGVKFNNSTTADPATNVGGLAFTGMGSPRFPIFNCMEGGAKATINGGAVAFSPFLTSYRAAHAGIATLDGVSGSVPSAKQIVPTAPTGVVAGTPFTDQGRLIGFSSAPSLVYNLDEGTPAILSGVTSTGWSTSLMVAASGGHTLMVSGAGVSGSVIFNAGASGGVTLNRVVAPLAGPVTAGTWVVNQQFNLAGSPSGSGKMQFNYRLPPQYDPSIVYPLLLVGHPNDDGMNGSSYPKDGTSFVTGQAYGGSYSIDSMFNQDLTFQRDFPCILVACQIDQTGNSGGANANGVPGYNDSQNSTWNEQAINGIIQAFIAGTIHAGLQVDPGRRYVIGYSLGGYLTQAEMTDNNQWATPPGGLPLWTAGITYSDGLFRPGTPNSSIFDRMATVPFTVISTTSDNDPTADDEPAWTHYTGNSTWPTQSNYDTGGMAAIRAGDTQFHYINFGSGQPAQEFMPTNANGGDGTALYTWLFSQVFGGTASGTGGSGVSGTASPDGSTIVAPTANTLTDSAGNAWGITASGKVSVNGSPDATTSNVTEMAWVGGTMWQKNSNALWWGKTSPTAAWAPTAGTLTSPLVSGGGRPIPSQAVAAGYNTLTFGPQVTIGENWFAPALPGINYLGANAVQNGDGSATVGPTASGAITTVKSASGPTTLEGIAFGGGGYFEITMTVSGGAINTTGGWPAFWANDIEIQATATVTPTTQWAGQASGVGNWIEVDIAEFATAGATTSTGNALHNWYGVVGSGDAVSTTFGAANVSGGTNINESHRYGLLWVPATATTQGSASFYIDDVLTNTVSWNQYDPSNPPPPVMGTSAFSVLDMRHLFLILSATPNNPVTVSAVRVWQESAAKNLPTPPAGTGAFVVSDGKIIDPAGKVFIARGINVRNDQLGTVCTNAACEPLTSFFSGINIIRLYYEGGTSPYSTSGLEPMIGRLTAAGIVVVIEDHTGISQPPYTGAALTAELAWYASLAATYKDNPYVWFGTFNEPGNGTNLPGIWAQEQAIYNAIRNAGSETILLLEEPSGGNVGLVGTHAQGYDGSPPMTTSAAGMHNVVWDNHFYGYVVNKIEGSYSTDIPTIQNVLAGSATGAYGVAACQTIQSDDGVVPVIVGEFGNSTDGVTVDANGSQLCTAVATSGYGFMAWAWDPDEQGDQLVTDGGSMTSYGSLIASLIATAATR